MTAPVWHDRARFRLRKIGEGEAVLARLRVDHGEGCTGPAPDVGGLPLGVNCERDDDCVSGRCAAVRLWRDDVGGAEARVCSECDDERICRAGKVCGVEAAKAFDPYHGCGAPRRHPLAARCFQGEECASGICCEGVCSTCCESKPCADDATCAMPDWESWGNDYEFQLLPHQCGPGAGGQAEGRWCLRNEDCASGSCDGTGELATCFLDGRLCEENEDCPHFEACLPLGVQDGICR